MWLLHMLRYMTAFLQGASSNQVICKSQQNGTTCDYIVGGLRSRVVCFLTIWAHSKVLVSTFGYEMILLKTPDMARHAGW